FAAALSRKLCTFEVEKQIARTGRRHTRQPPVRQNWKKHLVNGLACLPTLKLESGLMADTFIGGHRAPGGLERNRQRQCRKLSQCCNIVRLQLVSLTSRDPGHKRQMVVVPSA